MQTSAMQAFTAEKLQNSFQKSQIDPKKHKKVNLVMGFEIPSYATTTQTNNMLSSTSISAKLMEERLLQ
jgi:hypothetical protein